MLTADGATTSEADGVVGEVTATEADAVWVVSACAIAVTVTVDGVGTALGAVYSPVVEMKPTVVLPPVTEFTCQVTAVLVVLPTVAVNCCVAPVLTDAEVGEIVIVTPVVVEDDELLFPPQPARPNSNAHATAAQNTTRFINSS
jgi:hypothetical protein